MAWHPFRNVGLKIVALALGTLLWLTVSGHQIERRVLVPLSYSNIPQPLQMTGDQVDEVTVQVRGVDNQVRALDPGALSVIVDLSDAHAGTNMLPLRIDEVVAPLGVEVLQIDPGTVTVTLEPSGQVAAEVHPNIDGEPAPGFVVTGVDVDPKTVAVVGPESRLKGAISVVTSRVSIEGRTSDVVQDVGVGVADAELRLREPRMVRVTVHIARAQPTLSPAPLPPPPPAEGGARR
jgi:YbbR domain-containing protein